MGFKFKLQNLLDYKITLEDLKKTDYSNSIYRLNEAEELLKKSIDKKKIFLKDLEDEKLSSNIGNLKIKNLYIEKLNLEIKRQKEIVKKRQDEKKLSQEALLEATKEKKAFEKLKEKRKEEFLLDEKRTEEKIIDEIVTFKSNAQ